MAEKNSLKTRLQLNMTFCGKKVILAADVTGVKDTKGASVLDFYGGTSGLNLSISDIIKDILAKVTTQDNRIDVPDSLIPDILLQDVLGHYSGKDKTITFVALTRIGSTQVRFVFQHNAQEKRFMFGVLTDLKEMSALPLVGEQLKGMGISNLGFIYASETANYPLPVIYTPEKKENNDNPFDIQRITFINTEKDAESYAKGFNFIGNLKLPATEKLMPLVLPLSKKEETAPTKATANLEAKKETPKTETTDIQKKNVAPTEKEKEANLPDPFNPDAKWFKLGKKLGPVTLNRVGFAYKKGLIKLLIDGNIAYAGFKLNLEGAGIGINPMEIFKGKFDSLSVELSGLGLSYQKPPLKISGMFLRAEPQSNEELSFYGGAEIATSAFGISGIGAYSKLKTGQISLFLYAMYNGPIGGPAFFFVTGIAAGFGYNRSIRMPLISEVNEFPLVAMALNPDPNKTLNDIVGDLARKQWIPSSAGDYWLAVGIKFTSFKILESFVLIAVQFGTKLEFAILGLSVLSFPSKKLPFVYIELALLARFSPDNGLISVEALITSNSYILHKDCKITGGFAFYTWVSGEHEGDFVVSLGGYHPNYKIPAHYPKVERLALSWKLSDKVSIRGELYFALTPKCMMMGGKWEVLFDIGFLKAYLAIWVNIYLEWAPFRYEFEIGIIIRIQATIGWKFIRKSFNIEMRASLKIWGPAFAGEALVDWSFYSFTISFGNSENKPPKPLSWEEFRKAFLPKDAKDAKDNQKELVINAKINSGVLNSYKNEQTGKIQTFVNPYTLIIALESFFPLKNITTQTKPLTDNTDMTISGNEGLFTLAKRNNVWGIKPMGNSNLDSTLNISITKEGKAINVEEFTLIANAKGMTPALWEDVKQANENETVIKNVLCGIELRTKEKIDTKTAISIDLATLKMEIYFKQTLYYLQNKDARGKDSEEYIRNELITNLNKAEKQAICADLCELGFELNVCEELEFEDLHLQTPLYLAALMQKTPER